MKRLSLLLLLTALPARAAARISAVLSFFLPPGAAAGFLASAGFLAGAARRAAAALAASASASIRSASSGEIFFKNATSMSNQATRAGSRNCTSALPL